MNVEKQNLNYMQIMHSRVPIRRPRRETHGTNVGLPPDGGIEPREKKVASTLPSLIV